jgi:predicted GIY-YIG superfamily endonuclease
MTNLTADHGPGTCYLLHFTEPYAGTPARTGNKPQIVSHYLGLAPVSLGRRLAAHRSGNGARLIAVISAAGIGWELARTWPPAPGLERRLKKRKKARELCPICSPGAGLGRWPARDQEES